jgi:FkbM family methyltransferase
MLGLPFARYYARFYVLVKRLTGRNLRGLGWALDRIKKPAIVEIEGFRFCLLPEISRAYGVMVAGHWNEPETHLFLDAFLEALGEKVTFIDVGSSVGEFAIPYAHHPQVQRVLAFEPLHWAAEAIRNTAEKEHLDNLRVIEKAVSDRAGTLSFDASHRSPTSSHLVDRSADRINEQPGAAVETTTLDAELKGLRPPAVILMDIEGGELAAMQGAIATLQSLKPMLIFEYNQTSKKCFTLEQVRALLGEEWTLYRLRRDGRLDHEEKDTWNMVAMPKGGPMNRAVQGLMACSP